MEFHFRAVDRISAEEIIAWHYEPPYDVYNLTVADLDVMLDPANAYYIAKVEGGKPLAFCCFGPDARVPGGSYDGDTGLDVGVGLRPDATGQGSGSSLIRAALEFGVETYGARRFGATVAAFNERGLKAASRAGFERTTSFTQADTGREWIQLLAEMP